MQSHVSRWEWLEVASCESGLHSRLSTCAHERRLALTTLFQAPANSMAWDAPMG